MRRGVMPDFFARVATRQPLCRSFSLAHTCQSQSANVQCPARVAWLAAKDENTTSLGRLALSPRTTRIPGVPRSRSPEKRGVEGLEGLEGPFQLGVLCLKNIPNPPGRCVLLLSGWCAIDIEMLFIDELPPIFRQILRPRSRLGAIRRSHKIPWQVTHLQS